MTERVNQPVFTNIGGVNFQTEAIRPSFTGKPVSQPYIQMVSDDKAEKRYRVELNDGTVVDYPEQPQENNANIMFSTHGDYQNPNKVIFSNIKGANITDTTKNDNYELRGCNDTNLDAQRETTLVHGYMSGPGVVYHEYETTLSKDNDNIKIVGGTNVNVNYTTGFDTFERH